MKLLKVAAGLFAAWLLVLFILGFAIGGKLGARVADRAGEPLGASAFVGHVDLGLIRGQLELSKVSIERNTGGQLAIKVAAVDCDLPPLGWALVDRECRTLEITGMRVSVSTAGVFEIKNPKAVPIRARRVVIDDAVLEFSPSAFIPSLGRIAFTIEHAEAKDTLFKTPLSWIFSLTALRAKIDLPAGVSVRLRYENGKLAVAGALFGASPVELPIELPVADLADDPRGELTKLANLGKDLAERVLAQRAKDWVKSKLP